MTSVPEDDMTRPVDEGAKIWDFASLAPVHGGDKIKNYTLESSDKSPGLVVPKDLVDVGIPEKGSTETKATSTPHNYDLSTSTTAPSTPTSTTKVTRKRRKLGPEDDFSDGSSRTPLTSTYDSDSDYEKSSKRRRRSGKSKANSKTASSKRASFAFQWRFPPPSDVEEDESGTGLCHYACYRTDEHDMILCDGTHCKSDGQWFHMSCVGFRAMPPQVLREDVKWFCFVCRKTEGGLMSEGIVESDRKLRRRV